MDGMFFLIPLQIFIVSFQGIGNCSLFSARYNPCMNEARGNKLGVEQKSFFFTYTKAYSFDLNIGFLQELNSSDTTGQPVHKGKPG